MADLMTAAKTDFKALASRYSDFLVPAVRLTIGSATYSSVTGKETQKGRMMVIHQAEAWLYHTEGSSVSVLIGDIYDLTASRFKDVAELGEKMSVEIGYGSTFSQIFEGFVGELQYQFLGTKQYVRVTGYDAVYLMTQNVSARYYQEKKYSDVVSEIIGGYSSILRTGKIDSTGEQKQPVLSCRSMSDYAYITEVLCPLADKEFFMFNGKAYFQPVKSRNTTPSVELVLGRGLYDFRMTAAYANLKLCAAGFPSADAEKKFSASVSDKADSAQKSAVSAAQTQYIPWMNAFDAAAAKNCAAYRMQQQISQRQTGEGRCVGIPEIIPGRCISVQGIKPAYNSRKFWIDSVHHRLDQNGFSTDFNVKGWS